MVLVAFRGAKLALFIEFWGIFYNALRFSGLFLEVASGPAVGAALGVEGLVGAAWGCGGEAEEAGQAYAEQVERSRELAVVGVSVFVAA